MKKAYGKPRKIITKRRELIKRIDEIATEYYAAGMKITVRHYSISFFGVCFSRSLELFRYSGTLIFCFFFSLLDI